MRLSGLSLFAVLLVSSVAFAQHHDAGSAPSAPSSPAPTAAPSAPAPTPVAPAPAPSAPPTPAPVVIHSSTPSPAPTPETHVASAPTAPRVSEPGVSQPRTPNAPNVPKAETSERTFSPTRAPEPERVVPGTKISGENRIASSPRVGEDPKKKESDVKPGDPDLRRKICLDGHCRESQTSTTESDLRRHLCIDGRCNCPSGETATNQGCVPTQVLMEQNASLTCLPGQYSNGVACVTAVAECAGVNGQAANYVAQLRGLRSQMDQACAQNSSSQDCEDAQANFRQTMLLYRSLWDGARSECRATLADPASF